MITTTTTTTCDHTHRRCECATEHMPMHVIVNKCDLLLLPIHCRIIVMEPRHTEYGVVTDEWEDDEIEMIGVGTNLRLG